MKQKTIKVQPKIKKLFKFRNWQFFALCMDSATIRVDQKLKIGEELIKMENISFCFTAEHKLFSLFSKVLNFLTNKLI